MSRPETAEETLARLRANKARHDKAYRDRSRAKIRAYEQARSEGGKRLVAAHRDEYETLMAIYRADGMPALKRGRAATAELRRRYPDEARRYTEEARS